MSESKNVVEHAWICITCGTQYRNSADPPANCAICSDPRQFVNLEGQQWTTLARLRETHTNRFTAEEPRMHSLHTEPGFGIGERAFLIQTSSGNILWDCISLLDDVTIETVCKLGGVDHIAISHPHYYTTMIEWSFAFDNAPIHVHEADRRWVMHPHENVRFWAGETFELGSGLTLIHTPGHFDGFQVLHWTDGAAGKGALLCGDQPQVCMDPQWLSFMYSYPNLVPLGPAEVRDILNRLQPWRFDRIYGAFPKRTVWKDAKNRLELSAERFLRAIGAV